MAETEVQKTNTGSKASYLTAGVAPRKLKQRSGWRSFIGTIHNHHLHLRPAGMFG
jgi:hypothetical protein